jgi:phage terminase large subunit-like protein
LTDYRHNLAQPTTLKSRRSSSLTALVRKQVAADPNLASLIEQAGRTSIAPAPVFRASAARAQAITDRAWLLSGPAETGKTYAGLYRLDTLARAYPDQYILARKVRVTMDSTVLNTWRRIIALRGGVEPFGGEHPQFYTYQNGARVWVVGFDNPDKILSGEFGGAYVKTRGAWRSSNRATKITPRCTMVLIGQSRGADPSPSSIN